MASPPPGVSPTLTSNLPNSRRVDPPAPSQPPPAATKPGRVARSQGDGKGVSHARAPEQLTIEIPSLRRVHPPSGPGAESPQSPSPANSEIVPGKGFDFTGWVRSWLPGSQPSGDSKTVEENDEEGSGT